MSPKETPGRDLRGHGRAIRDQFFPKGFIRMTFHSASASIDQAYCPTCGTALDLIAEGGNE
jgi:hypothetical protein